jgi:hypothetical protein
VSDVSAGAFAVNYGYKKFMVVFFARILEKGQCDGYVLLSMQYGEREDGFALPSSVSNQNRCLNNALSVVYGKPT